MILVVDLNRKENFMADAVSNFEVSWAGAAVLDISAYRRGDMDFSFDLEDYDAGSETFTLAIYDRRGGTSQVTVVPTTSVETQTFQYWIDQGYFTAQDLPADMQLTDDYIISTFMLDVSASVLNGLPKTTEDGYGKTVLHYELYEDSGSVRIVEGKFTILE